MKWLLKLVSRKRRKSTAKEGKEKKKEECDITTDESKEHEIPSEIMVPTFSEEGSFLYKDSVSVLDPSVMAGVDEPESLYRKKRKKPLFDSCHHADASCVTASFSTIFCFSGE